MADPTKPTSSAPQAPAARSVAKPAAKPAAAKPKQPRPKGPPSGSGPAKVKASGLRLPDRLRPPAKSPTKMAATFVNARQLIDDVLGDQNQRVTELQLNANHGLAESLSRFQESCQFVRAVLERNDALAREAERLGAEGADLGVQQDDLETDVRRLAGFNQALADRVNALRRERHRIEGETRRLEDAERIDLEKGAKARADLDAARTKAEATAAEVTELERERARVQEHLATLERLREDYMSQVRQANKAVADLTKDG